ncbi:hypothetical protein C8J57DRAFT_1732448 [Mycena rebaudengoi]|nr:hypothetical protein C8J57DRAFT_1732448 [Mycena rebaudengoi]
MSHNYGLRPSFHQLDSDSFADELDAESTIGATFSPLGPSLGDYDLPDDVPFLDLGSDDFIGDENFDSAMLPSSSSPLRALDNCHFKTSALQDSSRFKSLQALEESSSPQPQGLKSFKILKFLFSLFCAPLKPPAPHGLQARRAPRSSPGPQAPAALLLAHTSSRRTQPRPRCLAVPAVHLCMFLYLSHSLLDSKACDILPCTLFLAPRFQH